MNILFLNHNAKGMGTYLRCFHFARQLVRFGHSVVILTSAPNIVLNKKRLFIDGVEVIYMPDILPKRYRNGGLGPIDTLLRCLYILKRRFDVVENYDHRPAVLFPALVSKYVCKTTLVSEWTDLHGTGGSLSNRSRKVQMLIGPYENFTERKSKMLAERLVVISRGLKNLASDMGIPKEIIHYIPGGSDIDNIKYQSKYEAREHFKLPYHKKIVGYTAGTHYDSDLLLNAISHIQKKSEDVLIITSGNYFEEQKKSQLYDPKRFIEFGHLPYKKYVKLLPAVDAFLFPFPNKTINHGRWPNKIGDYMAAGRPTISNRTGDLVELFDTHKIGLLAVDDYEDIAEKTLTILKQKKLCYELGLNARKAAEKYYDWSILARKLEVCFKSALRRVEIQGKLK